MMGIDSQMEREETAIDEAVERGDMTQTEATKALRDLYGERMEAAQEAAQEAYDREYERW